MPPPAAGVAVTKNLTASTKFPASTTQTQAPLTQSDPKANLALGTSQSFHRPYQFRPRFPPNKGQDDVSGLMYDGKRMRKAIHRKTVDYNPSVFKYLQ
ncbi:WD repeat-containing protein 33, partial [Biomphalaria glabrata]